MRVVVADDAMLIREGLARLLEDAGCQVVGKASDGPGAVREVGLADPDVAIIDIRMPPTHTDEGIVAAHRIRQQFPRVAVLVLSQYLESHYAFKLLHDAPVGVGYLLKDRVSDVAVLLDALQRLTAGETVIDPTIVSRLMRRPDRNAPVALTPREEAVLSLMAEGRSNAGIANRLALSRRTVETHVRQIMQKMGLADEADDHRRVLAVLTYLRDSPSP